METETTIRPASIADARAIAAVHFAAWEAAYTGLVPEETILERSLERREEQWSRQLAQPLSNERTWVALQSGEVVGFASTRPTPDDDLESDIHELTALYLVSRVWRRGVGGALLATVEDALRVSGITSASLWVLEHNDRARRFYEARGWKREKHEADYPGFGAPAFRYLKELTTTSSSARADG
jgi:ribosomal protein S18 acetylase RimI-like enzyme